MNAHRHHESPFPPQPRSLARDTQIMNLLQLAPNIQE